MALAYVSGSIGPASQSSTTPLQSVVVTLPTSSVGDVCMIAAVAAPAVVWNNLPSGWSTVATSATTGGRSLILLARTIDGTEGASVTVGHDSASNASMAHAAWLTRPDSGWVGAIDISGTGDSGGASNTSVTFPDVTTTTANEVLYYIEASNVATSTSQSISATPGTELLDAQSANVTGAICHISVSTETVAAIGAIGSKTGTLALSRPWQAITVAVRQGAVSGDMVSPRGVMRGVTRGTIS